MQEMRVLTYREQLRDSKRQILEGALAEAGGCVHKAARLLSVNRTFFYRLLRQAGMSPQRVVPRSCGNDAWRSLASRLPPTNMTVP